MSLTNPSSSMSKMYEGLPNFVPSRLYMTEMSAPDSSCDLMNASKVVLRMMLQPVTIMYVVRDCLRKSMMPVSSSSELIPVASENKGIPVQAPPVAVVADANIFY